MPKSDHNRIFSNVKQMVTTSATFLTEVRTNISIQPVARRSACKYVADSTSQVVAGRLSAMYMNGRFLHVHMPCLCSMAYVFFYTNIIKTVYRLKKAPPPYCITIISL